MLAQYSSIILIKPITNNGNKKEKKKEKEIVNFYALALYIYNNFDLCLSIYLFYIYIKCGGYLLVERMYLFIGNVVCECNFAF